MVQNYKITKKNRIFKVSLGSPVLQNGPVKIKPKRSNAKFARTWEP
jgi:hypothetical protein